MYRKKGPRLLMLEKDLCWCRNSKEFPWFVACGNSKDCSSASMVRASKLNLILRITNLKSTHSEKNTYRVVYYKVPSTGCNASKIELLV
jgi:hypothetical protein